MASVGDIIRVKFKGTYLEQEVLNVFFWRILQSDEPEVVLFALLDDIVAEFSARILQYQSDALTYTTFEADNLTDGVEFSEYGTTITGQIAAAGMPSYVALGVRLNRTSKVTRNGAKRFSGVVETRVEDNAQTYSAGEITQIETFCGSVLSLEDYDGDGNTVVIQPVIVGRTLNAQGKYELDLTRVNTVVSATVKPNITTQNTRKA